MKIDPRAESTREVAPVVPDTTFPPPKPPEKKAEDGVTLSGDMKVADQAVRAAAISGDVRPDAVARARRLLQSGSLMAETEALAERIIDSLVQARADRP
jgi:hypothetical protein